MKRFFLTFFLAALTALTAMATSDTVTFLTTIHCANCEQRIRKNVRFEKGVKKIDVRLDNKTVTITYDKAKTSPEALRAAIEKLGYKAEPVKQPDTK